MPAVHAAPAAEKSDSHDLPLLADNDEASVEASDKEKNQDSERSA